ncbi:MobQ family relaxase [Xanthomonas oryzae pv. oryzicola]|uniref:MobQ family relaxase n=1 Tax=Xanthomonas oryzae TaxID=347 RepID=UPI002DE2D3B8|nr:MobQ family relaxase [Xanthomonas oryzae pv. oryzicola]
MYRCELNYISRSGGKKGRPDAAAGVEHQFSVTAAIAYRTGSMVTDHRTGVVHDYRRKQRVEHTEIVVPAMAPVWARHRETLWNAAEAAESRKDARLANEFILCLPYGMSLAREIAMVREFAQAVMERHGIAIEFAIHEDDARRWDGGGKRSGGRHAHVLMSTRALTSEGFSKDKAREFTGLKDGPKTLEFWRRQWAEIGNRHMAAAGLSEQWDHRAIQLQRQDAEARGEHLKAIELDRLPGVHLGTVATAFERRGIGTFLGDLNRAIAAENRSRRLARQRRGVEASIAEFEARLDALREESAPGPAPVTKRRGKDDPRWPEYEAEVRRLGHDSSVDPQALELTLHPRIEEQFVVLADAMASQGGVAELARRMVESIAEQERLEGTAAIGTALDGSPADDAGIPGPNLEP